MAINDRSGPYSCPRGTHTSHERLVFADQDVARQVLDGSNLHALHGTHPPGLDEGVDPALCIFHRPIELGFVERLYRRLSGFGLGRQDLRDKQLNGRQARAPVKLIEQLRHLGKGGGRRADQHQITRSLG